MSYKKRSFYVAYNDCEGEFSLSREALEWLADRGVIKAHEILNEIEDEHGNVHIDETMLNMKRHNSLLILCIENIGSLKASGIGAMIRIRPISSNRYMLKNMGGIETVLTPDDIIWVEVE